MGDHLVGIGVGRSPGTGLENVEDEVLIEVSGHHFLGRLLDRGSDRLGGIAFLFPATVAAAPLIRPRAQMKSRPNRRLEIGKLSWARWVEAP